MADFESALSLVLVQEGNVLVNDPNDPGGVSHWGISLRFLRNEGKVDANFDGKPGIDENDIKVMTPEQRDNLYKVCFWDALHLSLVANQHIATAIFSSAVNIGQSKAVVLIQEAVNELSGRSLLITDGILGQLTIRAINARPIDKLLTTYKDFLSKYYIYLAGSTPKLKMYLKGWLNRVQAF
jgi:lysozyme family protein